MSAIALVVMAAGGSARLGRDKLFEEILGKPVYLWALDAIPEGVFAKVVVVAGGKRILDEAHRRGYIPVLNADSALGASLTVRLGLEKVKDAELAMFMVADQPLLSRESVRRLAIAALERPDSITALGYGGRRGNPVVFPRRLFGELFALEGDRGGSAVVRAHADCLALIEAMSECELMDADDEASLDAIRKEAQCKRVM